MVEPRRTACDPERAHKRAPGTRVDGNGAAAVVPSAAGAGAHRPGDSTARPSLGHVLQTGGLLRPTHRPVASPGR